MRFVGIVERGKSSPKAWRWWQQQEWAAQFSPGAIKSISVSPRFWRYLGNSQVKLCESNPSWGWGAGEPGKKPYSSELNAALSLARGLYEVGTSRTERHALSGQLASLPGVRHRWCRGLISAIRGKAAR